jgi:C1A family cysteine protease
MKFLVTFSLAIVLFSAFASCDITAPSVKSTILSEFMNKSTKDLFKVWHFLYNKNYDYNTEEGIRKYVTFRENVKQIQEHNAKNLSYQKGINHLTDMTAEEVRSYYKLKPMSVKEYKTNMRKLLSLDDYNDDEVVQASTQVSATRDNINWISIMRPVRNQANCGSCWAFTVTAVLEGHWNKYKTALTDHLSTQQMVDCDTGNGGCNGGWFDAGFAFFKSKYAAYETNYPYTSGDSGVAGSCQTVSKYSSVKITGYKQKTYTTDVYTLLKSGPVAVAVDATDDWYAYRSGVFNVSCSSNINHAVTLVGYGNRNGVGYWIIRNSWGSDWGYAGHIYVKDNSSNNSSCNIESYGFAPTL